MEPGRGLRDASSAGPGYIQQLELVASVYLAVFYNYERSNYEGTRTHRCWIEYKQALEVVYEKEITELLSCPIHLRATPPIVDSAFLN